MRRDCLNAVIALCLALPAVVASRAAAAGDAPATFFRGLNLNGPALVIDGNAWEGQDSKHYVCRGSAFENQTVRLKPATDRERSRMIRSSRWGGNLDIELTNIPDGDYQVAVYVWEDNDPEIYDLLIDGRTVLPRYNSGAAGNWARLGPWKVNVTRGQIDVAARGGAANLSGIEVWSGHGSIPQSKPETELAANPTQEQLEFFENRIRPLFATHCYECHAADSKKLGGSLLLDSRAGIAKGGDTEPPVVPGDPEASLLMVAVRHEDGGLKMPPKGRMSDAEIADLETWIRQGAPDPRTADTTATLQKYAIDWEAGRQFWSFRPLAQAAIPAVDNNAWPNNDLDRFILAKIEAAGLTPAEPADKRTLIRRVTFDLTGLPPTPEEIDAFVADASPTAYVKLVDRLLATPQYGERWGRYWLDVVRYADTAGDNSDFPIPQMYRYRNWVISAFNRDLPYDQFVRQQLAGDLLPAADVQQRQEQLIATGYIANARRFGSRVSDYPQHLTIEDSLDNLGRAFLGLSINCSRCHDHKFDPISTQDYYALYGIFHSTRYPWPGIELEQKQRDLVPLVPREQAEASLKARSERQQQLDGDVQRLEKERESAPAEQREEFDKRIKSARDQAEAFAKTPLDFEQAYAVAEGATIEGVRVQNKGDPGKLGPAVERRFLTILGGQPLPAGDRSSGRRQLAEWIVDPGNPLAARVMVNRIWLHHFGKGLVPTPNDFGKQGRPPSHPELLDWLARQFMESGWSIKSMHRLILLSRTYQLSSAAGADHAVDLDNELLAHFPRRRLDAEAIRDTLLFLGGNLDLTPGGPHPFPPQTEWKFTQHNPFKAVYDTPRRSVYLMTQRIQRHPYLAIFDGADPSASTPRRLTSTTPLQALYLLNDPFVHEQARGFAARLLASTGEEPSRLALAYRMALGRVPDSDEVQSAREFLSNARHLMRQAEVADDQVEVEAWQSLCRALFRVNEFVYIE